MRQLTIASQNLARLAGGGRRIGRTDLGSDTHQCGGQAKQADHHDAFQLIGFSHHDVDPLFPSARFQGMNNSKYKAAVKC
jgi:hypothetical protein